MSSSDHINFQGVNWRELPLFRFSIPFITGIILYSPPLFEWLLIAALGAFIVVYKAALPVISGYRIHVVTWLACLTLGVVVHWCADTQRREHHRVSSRISDIYLGTVESCSPYSRGTRVILHLRYGIVGDSAFGLSGKLLAYLQYDTGDPSPAPGDTVIFAEAPDTIPAIRNPFQWNPASYYGNQQVHHRIFLAGDEYDIRRFKGFHLGRISHSLRDNLQAHLRSIVADTTALAVLNAMLLGDKSLISSELRTDYVRSGIIHILAISGLHIGIVATILVLLTGRPRQGQRLVASLSRTALILAGIWSFTLISGMSPSATRAALMCTIATLGISWQRRSRPLNILGCSAMVVLVIDPYTLYSISFQFSFLALTGILVFAQPLFRLVTVRSRFIRYAWAIIAVSIAAQIPIAPAMIYYFGQMSTLSPVMSIAAIPAAFCVVAGGIGIMVMAMIFPGVTHFVADVVTWIIRTLNTMASRASDLSFSYLPIQMDAGALVFVYLVAGCLVMRFLTANRRWTLYAVLPALAATIISAIHIKTTLHTPVMAIFPGSPASIEYYYRGGCHSTVVPGTLSNFDSTALLKARHMHFINRIIRDSCASGSSIATVEMSDAIIHIAGTHTSSDSIASNAHRQFLYITAVPDSASLSKLLVSGVGQVIMAAHLWQRERTMIIRMCDRALIPWHDMRSHGAYYCKLTR